MSRTLAARVKRLERSAGATEGAPCPVCGETKSWEPEERMYAAPYCADYITRGPCPHCGRWPLLVTLFIGETI